MSTQNRTARHPHAAALALLAACTAGPVLAQAPLPSQADQAAQPAQPRRFDISPGTLSETLEAYRRITGHSVQVELPHGSPADFRSPGVQGMLDPQAALRALLEGTGLSAFFPTAAAPIVSLRASERVEVEGDALPDAIALNKFTQPLIDTPQTVAVIPRFVLEDQGVTSLRDTLRNVPGISLAAGEAGAQGDNLTIRGFTARNDIFLDGIRDFGSYYRDAFNYEQVEALEGPAGIAFGRGSTGGVINQESKVPQATPHIEVDAQFGTNLERRLTADINQPLPQLPGEGAARVNAMAVESGVAGRPYARVRRYGFAPSLTLGINAPTRFTLSYFHLTESDTPDYGLPWFYNRLAPGVNRSAYFGFAEQNYLRTSDDIVTARLDHTFNPHVTLHSLTRAANYPRSAQITEPQICTNAPSSVPAGGYVTVLPTSSVTNAACPYVPGAVDPATILVNRNQIQVKSVESNLWEQTEATLRFRIFGLRHEFLGGAEGGQETSNPTRYAYTINKLNSVPSTTLLNPNTAQIFGGTGYISSIVHTKAESVGLYFVDTLHLGQRVELSGGVRWDRFDVSYNGYQPTPPAGGAAAASSTLGILTRVDAQPTYRAALVYKANRKGSVYFDYGTSFNPSAETLALTSAVQNVAPEQNETFELGAKQSFLNERLMMEAAAFRTEKINARETDPNNSNNVVVAGNQRVRGVQVSAVGRLRHGMDVVAGYAYLDSAVTASQFYPTSVGYQLANVPKQTFNVFTTHTLWLGFSGGLGGNYVASRTASSTTPYVPLTFGPARSFAAGTAPCGMAATTVCYQVLSTGMKQVPGYWVFNAMLRRPLTERLELQANVNNLLNRFFIDQPHPSHLVPGEGLNALLGMNFKF